MVWITVATRFATTNWSYRAESSIDWVLFGWSETVLRIPKVRYQPATGPCSEPYDSSPHPHTLLFLVFILMLTSSWSLRLSFGLAACFGFPTNVLYAFLSSLLGHELFLLLLILIFLLLILLLLLLPSSSSMTLQSFDFELSLPYDSRPLRLES